MIVTKFLTLTLNLNRVSLKYEGQIDPQEKNTFKKARLIRIKTGALKVHVKFKKDLEIEFIGLLLKKCF